MQNETILLYLTWLGMAVAGGGVVLWVRATHPEYFKSLLPFQRERAVTWNGIEIVLIVIFDFFIVWGVIAFALDQIGFYQWMYGMRLRPESTPLELERMYLWGKAFAMPIELLFVALILGVRGETSAYQIGLTTSRWVRNVIVGYFGWLIVTPVVLALALATEKLFVPEKHALLGLGQSHPSWQEWCLIFFLAVVQAPVIEEIIFRGLLQRWVMQRSWGPDLALALSFIVALMLREPDLKTALGSSASDRRLAALGMALAPALFVLAMIPGYVYCEMLTWRWLPYAGVGRSIYATSLLFAAGHSAVWPTPIPLFFLALGLGYLAYRTQSLVAPITMHALFNAVSCIVLVIGPAENQDKKGSDEISALRRSAPAATSTRVPGSSLPRRTYPSAIALPSREE